MRKTDIWHVELKHAGFCCQGEAATERRAVIRPKKKKKNIQGEEFSEAWKLCETECCKVAKGELRDKSEQRCLAVNQLTSTLLIYLFRC